MAFATGNKSELNRPAIVVEPTQHILDLDLRSVWQYRELLYYLAWRDIKVRYKQTILGAAWAIFQPVMTMLIFTVIFGQFARFPSDGLPYPIFAYTALLPWTYFARSLERSGTSLVSSSTLVSKVYFPRLIIPIAATLAPLVDFALAFLVLLGLMVYYQVVPTMGVLALPIFILLATLTALAVSSYVSALHVKYRDVGHIIPFFIQFWMYASPVAYSVSMIPEEWRFLYSLNPMVGVIEGMRWALLGKEGPDFGVMLMSSCVVLLLLFGGLVYFRRTERTFADVI
jgi:lipopolysaccharide transport system permease protein